MAAEFNGKRLVKLVQNRICIFCGAEANIAPGYVAVAQEMGSELARRGITLVYGGGPTGMMGALADGVLSNGGDVIGVLTRLLARRESRQHNGTDMHVVQDMSQRKALMAKLADGFIVLPGGLGTYDELFEMLTWSQLGLHDKPVVLLNVDGHFDPLMVLLERAADAGFVRGEHCSLATFTSSVRSAVDMIVEPHRMRRPSLEDALEKSGSFR